MSFFEWVTLLKTIGLTGAKTIGKLFIEIFGIFKPATLAIISIGALVGAGLYALNHKD